MANISSLGRLWEQVPASLHQQADPIIQEVREIFEKIKQAIILYWNRAVSCAKKCSSAAPFLCFRILDFWNPPPIHSRVETAGLWFFTYWRREGAQAAAEECVAAKRELQTLAKENQGLAKQVEQLSAENKELADRWRESESLRSDRDALLMERNALVRERKIREGQQPATPGELDIASAVLPPEQYKWVKYFLSKEPRIA